MIAHIIPHIISHSVFSFAILGFFIRCCQLQYNYLFVYLSFIQMTLCQHIAYISMARSLEQIPVSVIYNIVVESEINGGYSFLCWNIVYKIFNEFGGIA